MTSAPPCNDRNISLSDYFSYIISDFNDFAKTPAVAAPSVGISHEEAVVPLVLDLVKLNYMYHSVIQHKTSLIVELSVKVRMESTPSTLPVPK